MKTAQAVVEAFCDKRIKRGATIWTDGTTLYSYEMPIARWCGDNVAIIKKGPTQTTNKHLGVVRRGVPAAWQTAVEEL